MMAEREIKQGGAAAALRRWVVETHLGDRETMARTAARALANVRWRIFGGCACGRCCEGWRVREA